MRVKSDRLFGMVFAVGLGLGMVLLTLFGGRAWADDPGLSASSSNSVISSRSSLTEITSSDGDLASLSTRSPAAAGDVIEVFTNTWSYSTIGLVYDSGRDQVRYAHESQSSTGNPTIYDVDYAVNHTLLFSFALSAQNSSWPWQIDNRDGAGYDFFEDTYFLPDYNGDLSYADDNIVEIDADGNILNAWEMDDEVGSNDSSDGSAIDSIIDIAVVPGIPTRYFATAAYDSNVVYEISLQKTGTWWTPNSWSTVATYSLPILSDNLGIDYDAEHEVLYHSGWHTTTILITDLNINPITEVSATFDCPGAGGYNSGVTAIEGSNPSEVWVTDFSSDQTTRCETPFVQETLTPDWAKWVDGQPWAADRVIEKQTGEIVQVTDIITALESFTLTESWNQDQLTLVGWDVFPPVGEVITSPGSLQLVGPPGPPETVILEKWFRVQPCNWTTTTLEEFLVIEGAPPFAVRPVTVTKLAPNLQINSVYEPEVYIGGIVSFTLNYSNSGGFENDVWIMNTFPITAPFAFAEPYPDYVSPDGTLTRWDIEYLAQGDSGRIDVYILISETLPSDSNISIWDGIFDHMDVLQDETWITFHTNEDVFPPIPWEKLVNGEPWRPGISVTLQTSQSLIIDEIIDPGPGNPFGFTLMEEWNPEELFLPPWFVEPPTYQPFVVSGPGIWMLAVPPGFYDGPVHIIKEFHVEPCNWPETILWESLAVGTGQYRVRPVLVNKLQPELWIDSSFEEDVYSREEAEFVLTYGNVGGFENQTWITNTFPAEARFVDSVPGPEDSAADGSWARWNLGALDMDQQGSITVTVEIAPELPPSTTIEIWDGIFDHMGELRDEVVTTFHVPPPTWDKWVNHEFWTPDTGVAVQTFDVFTVTDVISTHSAVAMVEHWNPERLRLSRYITESAAPGVIHGDPGFIAWEFPGGAPGLITMTKIFHVEPCTWTYTVLWEELWVEGIEWERRPVHVDKQPSELWIESSFEEDVYSGDLAQFVLTFGNIGGLESRAWITNTFPIEAPFADSNPWPEEVGPGGRWARWEVDPLATGEERSITVTVEITPGLQPSTTIEVWDGIFDHMGVLRDEVVITYHVPPPTWTKWVNGAEWTPDTGVAVQTFDVFTITDVISTRSAVAMVENWNPEHLSLSEIITQSTTPGVIDADPGFLAWGFPDGVPGLITITKVFMVEPCTWTYTILNEELWVERVEWEQRLVDVNKQPSELWIDSTYEPHIFAGDQVTFVLSYSNTGGLESLAWITNTFPAEALFVQAEPEPTAEDPNGRWALWNVGVLETGERHAITVTVAITTSLPPNTIVPIYDYIYDHSDVERDWTVINFERGPSIYLPLIVRDSG